MKPLLLDTHAFLFAIAEPDRLSSQVRGWLADPAVDRWVSAVSLWEIAVKVQIGKLALPLERAFYVKHIEALRARVLAVEWSHSLALLELPVHHRDPFDRLLIAQALEERLTLVSHDEVFSRYAVDIVW